MNIKNLAKYLVPIVAVVGIIAIESPSSFAAPQTSHRDSVNHRLWEQHKRIEQGAHNGSLTRRERERLAARDARIRYQESKMRLAHNGHLTARERARLERELHHNSKAIYHEKHDPQHRF